MKKGGWSTPPHHQLRLTICTASPPIQIDDLHRWLPYHSRSPNGLPERKEEREGRTLEWGCIEVMRGRAKIERDWGVRKWKYRVKREERKCEMFSQNFKCKTQICSLIWLIEIFHFWLNILLQNKHRKMKKYFLKIFYIKTNGV